MGTSFWDLVEKEKKKKFGLNSGLNINTPTQAPTGAFGELVKEEKFKSSPYTAFDDDIAPVKTTSTSSPINDKKLTNFFTVTEKEDFKEKSGYIGTKAEGFWDKLNSKYGLGYTDLQYEYINNQNGIRDEISQRARSWGSDTGKTTSSYEENALDYMKAEEIAVYNYYYHTEGKEKAQEFLDTLAETLNKRKAGKDFSAIQGKTAAEILHGMDAGTHQFEQGVKNLGNMIVGKDDYIPLTSTQILTGMVREDLADDGFNVLGNSLGQVAFDALSTGANMAPSIAVSAAVSAFNPVAGQIVGNALMGSSAAGNAYQQVLNEGHDKDKARTYATSIGVLEGTLQYVLGGIGKLGGTSSYISNAVSGIKNGLLRFSLEYGSKIGSEALEEGLQEILDPLVKNAVTGTNEEVDWENVVYSGLLGGLMAGVYGASEVSNSHLSNDEQTVFDKATEALIASREQKFGRELTSKEKREARQEIRENLEHGGLEIDSIAEFLGGESYEAFKAESDSFFGSEAYKAMREAERNEKLLPELQKEYDKLHAIMPEKKTGAQQNKEASLLEQINAIKNAPKSSDLKAQIDPNAIKRLVESRNKMHQDTFARVKNSRLAESYLEDERSRQKLDIDVNKYTDENARKTVQAIIDSGLGDNSNSFKHFVDLVAQVSARHKSLYFDLTENKRLGIDHTREGLTTNGYKLTDENGTTIVINKDAANPLRVVVGHEFAHVLEKSGFYDAISDTALKFAELKEGKAGLKARLDEATRIYKDDKNTTPEKEVVADLIGEYVFTDYEFIKNLAKTNRKGFMKLFDEVKYLTRVATAGSKVYRELAKLKNNFERAYREYGSSESNVDGGVQHSFYSRPDFNKEEWAIVNRRKHSEFDNPKYDLDNGNKWMYANEKGYTVFAVYSKYDPEDPTVLYGSSGKAAARDYATVVAHQQGGTNANRGRTTLDRLLAYLESNEVQRNNGLTDPKGTLPATEDVSLPFGQSRSNGRGDYLDGGENLQGTELTKYDDEASGEPGASITFSNDYQYFRNRLKEGDTGESDVQYSLSAVEAVEPSSDLWHRTFTTDEAKAIFPDMWNVAAEESEVRNPTQITSTVKSYRKVYDFLNAEGFDGTILDASSGLGYGTKAGIEEYGFNVEDIEPYPDSSYDPKYRDYSTLDKKYDAIISNAVLNVLPQDQRDALVVKMGELLNDGGRIFINVRGKDVESLAKTGKNIQLGNMEWIETVKGSYQKGFTKDELVAYLKDALGDGFTVEKTNMFGAVSAIVTKDSGVKYSMSKETTKVDNDYLDALNRGDTDVAQRMVDAAAFRAGYRTFAYHGTNADFFTFDKDMVGKGTDQYGAGFYFASDKKAARHYGSRVINSALKLDNPFVISSVNLLDAEITLSDQQAYEIVKRHPLMYDPEESPLGDYYDSYWEHGAEEWMVEDLAMQYTDLGYLDSDLFRHYPNELHEAIKDVTGHDGIVVNLTNGEKFYIAWFDNQMKSTDAVTYDDSGNVIPLSERFNSERNDIRYSMTKDSLARDVSKELEDLLQFSKVRDENGHLIPMYHGTPNGSIAQFRAGTYFTDNNEYADRYQNPGASSISTGKTVTNPKTFEVYLDIRKPFDLNDPEARRIYIEEYIKGGNAIGINPYLSDAEYSKIKSIDWTEGEDLRDFLTENGYDYDGLVLDEGADGGYGEEVKYRGKSYVIFSPEQAVSVDSKFSLSDAGKEQSAESKFLKYTRGAGRRNSFAEKLADLAPVRDDIAPVREDAVAEESTVAETPATTETDLFPDEPISIEQLNDELDEVRNLLQMAVDVGDYEAISQYTAEHENLRRQLAEYEADDADRFGSIEDTDAPPEIDIAPVERASVVPLTKKAAQDIARDVRQKLGLSNKHMYDVHMLVEEYSQTEFPDREQLFNKLKEKFGTYTESEFDETVKDAKSYLRNNGLFVSDSIQKEIADYAHLMRKNRGRIRFSNEGTEVDVLYHELNTLYPHLFPDDILSPTDQFLQMVDVANMDAESKVEMELPDEEIWEVADAVRNSVTEYQQSQKEKAANKYSRESFNSLMRNADQYAPPVEEDIAPVEASKPATANERLAKKIANYENELAANQRKREQSAIDYDNEIARLQAEYDAKQNKRSMAAHDILRRIERLKRLKNNIDADYAKRINDLGNRIEKLNTKEAKTAAQRQTKMEQHTEFWKNVIGDTSTWKDLPLGLMYKTKTLRRILRTVVRDADGKPNIALADQIYTALETKYDYHEAQLKRESRKVKEVFQKLKLNHAEDTYAHMLGEVRHNPETTLTEDMVKDYYNKHKGRIDTKKVDTAIDEARKTFDALIERVNKALREQGFKEIPYRQGYFPHFTNPKQGWLAKLLNWKTIDNEIPTSIAGLTETFTPQRSWQSFNKQRKGDTTDYSLYQGLDTYIHGALDWIYHIDDLQSRRALENHLRYIHSEEGVKARIDEIKANEEYDADEAQALIDAVLKEADNPLGGLVTELMRRTNTLANKKASGDRKIEEDTNRKIYSVMTNLNNRINANMVVGSFSSALTNVIPMVQSWHQVSPWFTVRGLGDFVRSVVRDDGMVEKSDYLTNRLIEEEKLYQTGWDKVTDKAAWLMNVIDNITAQTVWRSKYLQNLKEGMSEERAIFDADQFAKNLMAGRSRGNAPTIFDEKNPVTKIFTAFQLEVANQYGYMFEDVPQDSTNKARLVKGYATAFLGAYLYNALYSSLVGRDAAFDPIGILEDLFRDLFGDDDEEEDEENVKDALFGLGENVIQQVPFVGGLIGGGRIPLSSALPYSNDSTPFQSMVSDIEKGVDEGDWTAIGKEMLKPLYYLAMPVGGGQLKKTFEGLSMFSSEHPVTGSYTDSGKLRFPVEATPGNVIQAAMFGQYASENARYYFDNDIAPLGEKQIQEYMDVDIPIKDYWNYRKGLKGKDTLGEKLAYIDKLDLPIRKQNILANNLSDRKEPINMADWDKYDGLEEYDYAKKYPEKYQFLEANGISVEEYNNFDDDTKEAYSWAYQNPDKYTLSKAVARDLMTYRKYANDLNDIKADKDEDGKSISGSRKDKVVEYINNMDADYGEKIILFKSEYPSDDTYNNEIVEYLNSREDISYDEEVTILRELGFTVLDDGTVLWD